MITILMLTIFAWICASILCKAFKRLHEEHSNYTFSELILLAMSNPPKNQQS
jgi:hypothetical protein